MTSVQIVRNES